MATKEPMTQYAVSEENRARFARLCDEAMLNRRSEGDGGFGTLAEKRMHAIIKRYLCPNEEFHEVGMDGTRYIADVCIGNRIFEVQTGAFYPMRKKIDYYMEKTDCTVTVVHPIALNKWVSWIDPATGEIQPRKRSPKHEKASDLLSEMYAFLPHLTNPRLCFRLLFIEAQDFRMLAPKGKNRKKGSERYERIPITLLGDQSFSTPKDFEAFLPADLPSPFTVKTFSDCTGIRGRDAYSAVRVLTALGLLQETDPIGRAMAFRRVL